MLLSSISNLLRIGRVKEVQGIQTECSFESYFTLSDLHIWI